MHLRKATSKPFESRLNRFKFSDESRDVLLEELKIPFFLFVGDVNNWHLFTIMVIVARTNKLIQIRAQENNSLRLSFLQKTVNC